MSASDAAPLPRLGEVYFDVRGDSRSMRLSWYADTGVAVFSIWQGGTCTGTFRLPIADLPRMVEALQRGPRGAAEEPAHEDFPAREGARPGPARGARPALLDDDAETGQQTAAMRPPGPLGEPATGLAPAADFQDDSLTTRPTPAGRYRGDPAAGYDERAAGYDDAAGYDGPATGYGEPAARYDDPAAGYGEPARGYGDPSGGYGDPSGGFPAERAARQQDDLGGPDPLGARGGRHSGRSHAQLSPEEYEDDLPGRHGAADGHPADGHPDAGGYGGHPGGYDDPLGYGGDRPDQAGPGRDGPGRALPSQRPPPGAGGGPPAGYGGQPPARYEEELPAHYREEPPAGYRDEPPPGRHGGGPAGHGGGGPAEYDEDPPGGYLDDPPLQYGDAPERGAGRHGGRVPAGYDEEPSGGYLDEPAGYGTGMPGQDLPGHSLPGHDLPGHDLPGHDLPGHDLPGHGSPGRGRHGAAGPGGYDEDQADFEDVPPGYEPGPLPGDYPTGPGDEPAPESFPYGAPPGAQRPRGRYPSR